MIIVPKDPARRLLARDYYICDDGICYYSAWYAWQRWIVVGLVLVFIACLLICCAAFSARRRRRHGLQPYYGTGWATHGAPPAYDTQNIGNTGPQYGGQTGYHTGNQYASHYGYGGPPPPPHPNAQVQTYDMPNYSGPYNPPTSPPPAHVTKY